MDPPLFLSLFLFYLDVCKLHEDYGEYNRFTSTELASNVSVETPHNFSATLITKDSHPAESQNEIPDTDSDISPVNSEIATPPRRSGRIQHAPQRYGNVARHLAMSTIAQEVIHKPLLYNQALQSPEAVRWQETMQEEYDALVENQIWDVFDIPTGHKVLQRK